MSLAAFRKQAHHDELTKLANEHINTDLEQSDREALMKATTRIATSTTVGSLVGLGLGLYAAIRLRKVRTDMFAAFRAAEKPSSVVFANGRQEPIPDVTPYMRPTKLGDFATYFFFGLGGTMLGGELGLFTGTRSASRNIGQDAARRERLERAYRLFKIDVLRKELAQLESGSTPIQF
ncbi:hypothetical protein F5B22DRAFT_645030 [Xylaria bambusicola]|uniref:uncharacterized protein n=1 Tax=Xylaria bambusicola TaxID=326684 RepID=UPI002007FEED|nr:uncharacterized protein F5B22DRAFT_645030 [Xylaria bambusicola]KAI0518265.1 hypothetical protein F5B22DRAFT_645030 [Xylaria bambusicola]